MIVIYEPQDMTERSRTKPATERTLNDVDPRALANPTIYIATDGVARLVKGTKSTDEEFEIRIERLK
jgi:hypothetical protein